MRQKSGPARESAEQVVKDIRRATRRHFSTQDKIGIVLEDLRGEDNIAELTLENLLLKKKLGIGRTALAMISKLAHAAEKNWRRLDGRNQLPKVIHGVKFVDGVGAIRQDHQADA